MKRSRLLPGLGLFFPALTLPFLHAEAPPRPGTPPAVPRPRAEILTEREDRLREIRELLNEKKKEADDAEEKARRLKESLATAQDKLEQAKEKIRTLERTKKELETKVRLHNAWLDRALTLEEAKREDLIALWSAYQRTGLKPPAEAPENQRLLALAVAAQTQTYEQSILHTGKLHAKTKALEARGRRLTEKERSERKVQEETLRLYKQKGTQYDRVKARRETLRQEVLALEASAKELTNLVNALRRETTPADARPAPARKAPEPLKPPIAAASLPWPAPGKIVKTFGKTIHPELSTPVYSNGITLACAPDDPVRAVAPGRVLFAGRFMSYGRIVLVEHAGDWHSIYGGLKEPLAVPDTPVERGDVIGRVEADPDGTATTYLELRVHGKPVDPVPWLSPQ